jgi:perosamine synthetase
LTDKFIPVFSPTIDEDDIKSVTNALRRGEISGASNIVLEFEEKFAESLGRTYAISVSNGSVALDLAFELLNLVPGDEVILPSFAIISCLSPILRSGATPIFVDCDPNTWVATEDEIIENITSRTKAVLIVHTYGIPVQIQKLLSLCDEQGILLIEDAAEAHGLSSRSGICGTLGDISTFSFYANKHITTGEGGMIVTDDKALASKARLLRNLAFQKERRFFHEDLGWNYRLGGLQAALGISQLDKLNKTIEQKQKQGLIYTESLESSFKKLQIPVLKSEEATNNYWVYGVVLKSGIREVVTESLIRKGIETRPFFFPLHQQPILMKFDIRVDSEFPNSERIGKNGFYLPMGSHVTPDDQEFIVNSLISLI